MGLNSVSNGTIAHSRSEPSLYFSYYRKVLFWHILWYIRCVCASTWTNRQSKETASTISNTSYYYIVYIFVVKTCWCCWQREILNNSLFWSCWYFFYSISMSVLRWQLSFKYYLLAQPPVIATRFSRLGVLRMMRPFSVFDLFSIFG